jgi:hypothetical protein
MIESGKSKNDVSLEAFPDSAVPLESILRTEELRHRLWRPPDYGKENSALANSPRAILQTLAEKVLEVLEADSAGLSLLKEDEKRFYCTAIAGAWQPHIGGGMPRDFSPCGIGKSAVLRAVLESDSKSRSNRCHRLTPRRVGNGEGGHGLRYSAMQSAPQSPSRGCELRICSR